MMAECAVFLPGSREGMLYLPPGDLLPETWNIAQFLLITYISVLID